MPRTSTENLIPRADKLLIRSFPKIAQRLSSEVDELDRAELDAWLKLLPGAIERFQAVSGPTNDMHDCVASAIGTLQTTFGSRNALAVDSMPPDGTSNTPLELEETTDSVGDSELPNGSDTDQSVASITLPHNELAAPSGNGGEPDSPQAGPRNPRVRKRSPFSGRRTVKRSRWASGESADDHGRLSESEGGPNAKE